MNLLFRRSYTYTLNQSLEETRDDLAQITDKKWWDYSENITGQLNEDNTFLFVHKWTWGSVSGLFGSQFVYLKGHLASQHEQTIITTHLNPNLGLVLVPYLMAVLWVVHVVSLVSKTEGEGQAVFLFFYPLFAAIILGVIRVMSKGLKNSFEKSLQLPPDPGLDQK